MKVLLRTGALTMMVVGATAADAVASVTRLPEFQGNTILEVNVKPIGGEEYAKLTLDFTTETGYMLPGIVSSDVTGHQVWQVTITFKHEVEWDESGAATRREQAELDLRTSSGIPGEAAPGGPLGEQPGREVSASPEEHGAGAGAVGGSFEGDSSEAPPPLTLSADPNDRM